jgi:hypothetical protein
MDFPRNSPSGKRVVRGENGIVIDSLQEDQCYSHLYFNMPSAATVPAAETNKYQYSISNTSDFYTLLF